MRATKIRAKTNMVPLPRQCRSSNLCNLRQTGPVVARNPLKSTSRLALKESRNGLSYFSPIGIHRRNAFNAKGVPCIFCRVSISLALPHQSWNLPEKPALG